MLWPSRKNDSPSALLVISYIYFKWQARETTELCGRGRKARGESCAERISCRFRGEEGAQQEEERWWAQLDRTSQSGSARKAEREREGGQGAGSGEVKGMNGGGAGGGAGGAKPKSNVSNGGAVCACMSR